jgi:hypothetical protein
MKYFTPERYVALQDFSGDAAMDAADAAWEQAAERYDDYNRFVEGVQPAEYRRLHDEYYLHDAQVLFLGPQGRDRFVIALRPDPPPQQVLQLTYELTGEPRITRDALPVAHREEGAGRWLYDEVELVGQSPLSCVHSILLSNGWEVQLPFRALRIEEVQALLPAPRNGHHAAIAPAPETV